MFYPAGSTSVSATTSASAAATLPTYGRALRLVRENNANRVFIAIGGSTVTATTSSVELIPGVVELWDLLPSNATHYSVITNSGTVGVNLSVSPLFNQP